MSLAPIPTDTRVSDGRGVLTPVYQSWFASIQRWLSPVGQFGTTAQRPTKNLFVGQPYYDTTLGYSINVHQVSPAIVWHNGAGAAV